MSFELVVTIHIYEAGGHQKTINWGCSPPVARWILLTAEHAESDQVQPEEPKVPPPEMVSMEIQTDESFLTEPKPGSSSKEEVPAPPGSSQKGEEQMEKNDDIQKDDTAPKKEPATRLYHAQEITGNEDDPFLREMAHWFSDGYYGE